MFNCMVFPRHNNRILGTTLKTRIFRQAIIDQKQYLRHILITGPVV